jgi:Amt family ammonium transporter
VQATGHFANLCARVTPHPSDNLAAAVMAGGALLVRVGFGWYAAGASRAKNAAGAVLRGVADLSIATLAFWAVGMAIQNASPGMLFDAKGNARGDQFAQMVLALIATAPITGALLERCKFWPTLGTPLLLGGLIVPLCARWAWQDGWLQRIGFFDAGGACVLHVVGGAAALAGALVVGPRAGKYNRDGSSNLIPGHSMPMLSVGVMLILAGWIPYMHAATLMHGGLSGRTAMNVLLAASAATVTALLLTNARYGKPDVALTLAGLLGGLVAISGGAGAVHTIGAVVIGAVAGAIVPTLTVLIDLVWKIDDPAGGVAVHLVGGACGTLAVGLFTPSSGIADTAKQIAIQSLGLFVMTALSFAATFGLFIALRFAVGLRLTEGAEYDGADLFEHDLNAYPDFQQTMIKSYHLREA